MTEKTRTVNWSFKMWPDFVTDLLLGFTLATAGFELEGSMILRGALLLLGGSYLVTGVIVAMVEWLGRRVK